MIGLEAVDVLKMESVGMGMGIVRERCITSTRQQPMSKTFSS